MDESKFWLCIWSIVGFCFCVLVGTLGSCTYGAEKLKANHPNPVEYACAQSIGDRGFSQPCDVLRNRAK